MSVSKAEGLAELARAEGWNLETVRTWGKRGAVPYDKLAQFAAKYAVPVNQLTGSVEAADLPTSYGSSGQIDSDSFSKRLAVAIDIVESGLAATCVDASKVPRSEMAAAVFKLLPWPIPKAQDTKKP